MNIVYMVSWMVTHERLQLLTVVPQNETSTYVVVWLLYGFCMILDTMTLDLSDTGLWWLT